MEYNCRMCLADDGKNQFQRFSHKLEDSLRVHDYYKLFTSVSLRNQDERTKSKICHKCLQKLLLFYNDRCKAITNNKILWKRNDEANDPTAGSQESTDVKDEPNINPAETPSTSVGIDDDKLEDNILLDGPLESTEVVKEEYVISDHQVSTVPLVTATIVTTSVVNNDVKLEENIQLDGPLVTTEVVKEEYVISEHQNLIAPLSDSCVSLTKPCKVVLKKCHESCYNDKSKDPSEKISNTDQDTSERININEDRQDNIAFINRLDPVVQKENLPTSKMTKSRKKGVNEKSEPIKHSIPEKTLRSNKSQQLKKTVDLKIYRFFCGVCSNGYSTNWVLKRHEKTHKKLLNPCKQKDCTKNCAHNINSASTKPHHSNPISEHVRGHTKIDAIFPCTYLNCVKIYNKSKELKRHINYKHLQERTHICPICKKGFLSASDCKLHMTTHEEKNLICDGCGKRFSNKMRLLTHYRQSHWAAPLVCSTCGKKFKKYQNRALRLHEQKHHVHQMAKKNPCSICKNTFESKTLMLAHVRAVHVRGHTKIDARFPCTYLNCGKIYNKSNLLNRHIKYKHLQERTHICPICKKGFLSASDCKLHMTTHEEKNLICDGCGKRFSNKMRLLTHYRQSHWAAPLVCSTCGKKFKKYQNRLLRLHEQKHHAHQMTKKNPCGICKNTFESSIIMFEHVRAVHFKSKMKCEHCETIFPRQEVYQDHVKAKHADIGPERIKKLLAKIDNIRADYEEMDWVYE